MASSRIETWGRWGTVAVAGAVVAALAAGCSGSKNTQGEIVVAIQTDLSLPKDVSQVRIQISTLGVIRFDNTYPVGPDPSMRIPATIGLLPGENPNAPIRIRIVGFKKEFQPRILREVVTTVPPSRVVSLRMPLQWLSDGSALVSPLGGTAGAASAGFVTTKDSTDPFAFYNRCPDGQTDVGGDCVSSTVDSSTLPDYLPADIFGGGDENGAGGTCFDTQPCMLPGVAVHPVTQPDGSCVVAAPSGDPSLVNVALEFGANGDGICADANGGGPCFVPLDKVDPATPNLGWTAGNEAAPVGGTGGTNSGVDAGGSDNPGGADASVPQADGGFQPIHQQGGDTPTGGTDASVSAPFTTIHLPAAVCRKLATPGFAGQVVVSDACTSKTAKNPTCGPWSSVSSSSSGPVSDAGITRPQADGSVGGDDAGILCSPTCNGSSNGSCGCSETCQGQSFSVQCSLDKASNTICTCVVNGQTLYSGAPPFAVNCSDSTGASIRAAFSACAQGASLDGGADAGLFLNIVPTSAVIAPLATQSFSVFLNAGPVPASSVQWSLDGTLALGGGFIDTAAGVYHSGDVVAASGHVIAQYAGQMAMAQVDVGTGPADAGTDAGITDAGFSCPQPTCNGGSSADGGTVCSCSAFCSDSQTWTLNCDGTTCGCMPGGTASFAQGNTCMDQPTASSVFFTQCHP